MKTHTIIIFPDGETWNTLDGCRIVVINEEQFKDLCDDQIKACDVQTLTHITLDMEDEQ
jgi:hypothetical protein